MSRRSLVPLGLLVTALVVLAAVASRGRPLGGGGGSGQGPTATFFDYVFTTIVIVAAVVAVVAVLGALASRGERRARPSPARRYLASMLAFLSLIAIAWLLGHSAFEKRLAEFVRKTRSGQTGRQPEQPSQPVTGTRGARLRWDEVAIVLALLAGAGVLAFASRTRVREARLRPQRASQAAVSAALDESLDDLRAEPDLRKAIVAAYARMERALAISGLARRPAEAPLEYVERALRELEASADAARRLTELFEWAKFSQHEPEPRMRDEAIDALVAVRDELRAPAREEAVA